MIQAVSPPAGAVRAIATGGAGVTGVAGADGADGASGAGAIPALRRLPPPRTEPPYDDEIVAPEGRGRPGPYSSGATPVQGTLALAFVLPNGLPAMPTAPRLRLLAGGASPDSDAPAPLMTPRSELPDPRSWAARLIQALVEVMAGERPVGQLVRWTDPDIFAELCRRSGRAKDRTLAAPAADAPRAAIRSVHVMEPGDGIAEVCALIQRGIRTTAIALRLEGRDGRWTCTALELG